MPRLQTEIDLPDRYLHARHLASGGMAAVFAAEDSLLRRPVAVKVLAERFLSDSRAVRRFQREARAAAKASQHPHVVTIYDVGEHDGRPFIVMELMSGGSLADRLNDDGTPARADALRWIRETASALDHAHAQGVVHRDVKPGNLLLDERGRLAVADFGIARLAFESSLTQTGQVLGTAAYLAPEQARGEGGSAASDRYALAVVAHELLTGARPGSTPPDVPPSIERALRRGLAVEPAARWPSCAAFADALGADGVAPTRQHLPPTRPLPRRRRTPVVALAGLGLGLVAVVLAIALSAGDDSKPTRADRTQPPGTTPATPAPAPAPPQPESAASLNDRGFALMNEGRYAEAIPVLQQAVARCGDSQESVCAYALYNLGHSLRLAGRPGEAIPVLERRLGYDDQTETVQSELDAARRDAGQASVPAPSGDEKAKPGKGKGKGKGHDKGGDEGGN